MPHATRPRFELTFPHLQLPPTTSTETGRFEFWRTTGFSDYLAGQFTTLLRHREDFLRVNIPSKFRAVAKGPLTISPYDSLSACK